MIGLDVNSAARERGEFEVISYSDAKKRKPKTGRSYWITPVSWVGAPEVVKTIDLRTIGQVELIQPTVLPSGYRVQHHDSWIKVAAQIYTPEKVEGLSFSKLDDIVRDWRSLEKIIGCHLDWFNLYDDRPDYCDWSCRLDESWDELENQLKAKFDALFWRTNPHLKPCSLTEDGITNREMAPTMEQALINMFGKDCQKFIDVLENEQLRSKDD